MTVLLSPLGHPASMFGIHFLDIFVIAGFLILVLFLGQGAARKSVSGQGNYFLAGRELIKICQFFLKFSNATAANGAIGFGTPVRRFSIRSVNP